MGISSSLALVSFSPQYLCFLSFLSSFLLLSLFLQLFFHSHFAVFESSPVFIAHFYASTSSLQLSSSVDFILGNEESKTILLLLISPLLLWCRFVFSYDSFLFRYPISSLQFLPHRRLSHPLYFFIVLILLLSSTLHIHLLFLFIWLLLLFFFIYSIFLHLIFYFISYLFCDIPYPFFFSCYSLEEQSFFSSSPLLTITCQSFYFIHIS